MCSEHNDLLEAIEQRAAEEARAKAAEKEYPLEETEYESAHTAVTHSPTPVSERWPDPIREIAYTRGYDCLSMGFMSVAAPFLDEPGNCTRVLGLDAPGRLLTHCDEQFRNRNYWCHPDRVGAGYNLRREGIELVATFQQALEKARGEVHKLLGEQGGPETGFGPDARRGWAVPQVEPTPSSNPTAVCHPPVDRPSRIWDSVLHPIKLCDFGRAPFLPSVPGLSFSRIKRSFPCFFFRLFPRRRPRSGFPDTGCGPAFWGLALLLCWVGEAIVEHLAAHLGYLRARLRLPHQVLWPWRPPRSARSLADLRVRLGRCVEPALG